jgi:hypothetical protein
MAEVVIRRSIFEMRYEAQPHFFDKRGAVLEQLFRDPSSEKPNFTHWQLRDNRVDVFEPDYDRLCFVSFRNSGYHIEYQPSDNFFRDQLRKYMRVPVEALGIRHLKRIGIRVGFVHPVRSFDDTVKRITRALYRTNDSRFVDLTKDIVDIQGVPFVCKEGRYAFRITAGAMKLAEYEQLNVFNRTEGLPEFSLWMDIDYATNDLDLGKESHRSLMEFLEHAESRVNQKHDVFVKMVLGGPGNGKGQ